MMQSSTVLSTKPLRVCRECGFAAHTEQELELFCKGKKHLFGRKRLCKKCFNYFSKHPKPKIPRPNYLRKCNVCGLIARTDSELGLFVQNKHMRFGYENICKKCKASLYRKGGKYHEKYVASTKRWREENPDKVNMMIQSLASRTINFKGKNLVLERDPRTYVCSECGKKYPDELKRRTGLHHDIYDLENPLAHTVELCVSCHSKLHASMRKRIKGVFVKINTVA